MFKGLKTFHNFDPEDTGKFRLGTKDQPFYDDNENPYVDIKLYPQDNWQEIIAAYVRKNAVPSMMEALQKRVPPGTAEARRKYLSENP